MAASAAPPAARIPAGSALRHSKTAVLVRLRGATPFPYQIRTRDDEKILSQHHYLIEALEAWATWYAR